MSRTPVRVEVAKDPEALAHRVAQRITDLAANSRGRFAICLSGGSTPRRLYQLLAENPYRDALPWERVHWFWGDERFVPWDPGLRAGAQILLWDGNPGSLPAAL